LYVQAYSLAAEVCLLHAIVQAASADDHLRRWRLRFGLWHTRKLARLPQQLFGEQARCFWHEVEGLLGFGEGGGLDDQLPAGADRRCDPSKRSPSAVLSCSSSTVSSIAAEKLMPSV
jgi:hypothetical protein